MKNSVKRLLLLAVSVIALALVVAPVTFAGEDDPGPTQAGEIQAPQDANTLVDLDEARAAAAGEVPV
jgi:hypothetical protein